MTVYIRTHFMWTVFFSVCHRKKNTCGYSIYCYYQDNSGTFVHYYIFAKLSKFIIKKKIYTMFILSLIIFNPL